MVADKANNNPYNMKSSQAVYQALQKLEIPTVVVTSEAAYAGLVGRDFYDGLGELNAQVALSALSKSVMLEGFSRTNRPTDSAVG